MGLIYLIHRPNNIIYPSLSRSIWPAFCCIIALRFPLLYNASNMSLKANALTTVARVKSVLRLSVTTYDSHIEDIINGVSQWVEDKTGRIFLGAYSATITEYPKAYGDKIFLKAYPIKEISSITEDNATLSYTSDSVGDYRFARSAAEGIVQRTGGYANFDSEVKGAGWSTAYRAIVVVYKGGYENQAALPADLVMAVDKICADTFKLEERAGGVQSESVGSYSVNYADLEKSANTNGVLDVIDRYANINL